MGKRKFNKNHYFFGRIKKFKKQLNEQQETIQVNRNNNEVMISYNNCSNPLDPRDENYVPKGKPNDKSKGSNNNRGRPNRPNINEKNSKSKHYDKHRPRNQHNGQNNQNSRLFFNYTRLKELSDKEPDDIVTTLRQKEAELEELLLEKMTAPDFIVLTLKILTKVCRANFTDIVIGVLSHACSAKFLQNLTTYLQKLATDGSFDKLKNRHYYDNKEEFWKNLVEFFKKIIELLPTKARDELTPILEKIKLIIISIEHIQDYKINDEVKSKIEKMSKDLDEEVKLFMEKNKVHTNFRTEMDTEEPPPNNYKLLSIIPTKEDLYNDKPYIRRCKIKDAYDSIDHYLDVQFRLLREDFITPLRNGIKEYLYEDNKYKNRDLRVYRNVKLVVPETTKNNVGILANFGVIKNTKWQYSKRFMFGGLVLLSRDNFDTILFATIANRDVKELEKGFILIEPCEGSNITQDMYQDQFVLLESKIYFEPYLAVLNAMQHMNERNFPMEFYLVNAGTRDQLPTYLLNHTTLTYKSLNFTVRDLQSWPSASTLGMDDTQYNAFKCALTQEFSVIQGPPGCGKTFIALEIVSALLENKKNWETYGPIVVVCLTNHALDQFLEGILNKKYTKSIVRIGSRSKSEILKPFTLMERRQVTRGLRKTDANRLLYETKHRLEDILRNIEKTRLCVKYLTTPRAIVPLECFRIYGENLPSEIERNEDLVNWLVGTNMILHPINENAAPQLLGENAEDNPMWTPEDLEDDNAMDDDLELDCNIEVDESFRPINLFRNLDIQIEKCLQEIFVIKRTPSEVMVDEQKIILISEMEKRIISLKEQYASLQRKLDKHPILNPQHFPIKNFRWRSYWNWVRSTHQKALNDITQLTAQYRQIDKELKDAKQLVDLATIKEHKIVGLTTNGAAKLHSSLRALHAPIVLVEEAAEILEAHVVCSMTQHCQQVILIGDHKQLRPKASVYELGTKYNLNISLFERMVNIRGNCAQLAHQHRMRPEFAKLITPSIYETLYNHESVLNYPNIKGVVKNLYFLNHENREISHNEESWVNKHEVGFLIAFAIHLVKQGYKPTEITILCTYTGQLFALMKEAQRYMILKQVRITTIDNYQGEENTIILLSLVRNNGEGKIGFLKEENRVCVALSRAREGMYIMGNMDDLIVKNTIWPKVKQNLEEDNAIGDSIELRCQIHPEQVIKVKNVNDFQQCPEGGCTKKCDADLSCSHTCTSICHILDREHKEYKCKQPCIKACPNEHPCQLRCFEGCKPCQVIVECTLKCEHTVKMRCSNDPLTFPCYIEVDVILPDCQHENKKPCHRPVEECRCIHPCETRLPCGHQCHLHCHVTKDPEHLQYRCFKDCPKNNIDCVNNHPCKKRCFEECDPCSMIVEKKRSCGHIDKRIKCSINIEEQQCTKPCKLTLDCGHKCKRKCSEKCGNCQTSVNKLSDCGHEIRVKCCEEATALRCSNKCKKILPCGHPCTTKCKDPCTMRCEKKVKLNSVGLCGHQLSVPCYLKETDPKSSELLKYCEQPCTEELSCSHRCKGTCGKCRQGRIHAPCGEPCNHLLICGHPCIIPCRSECQPCNKLCELQCSHSKCKKKCGIPCNPCAEPCVWRCEHRRCSKRCSELCDVDPCPEPCKNVLKCGHPCIGFCGELCPPLCRICDNEELTDLILSGLEEEPNARFIYLEDCKHCIESTALMTWVQQDETTDQALGIKTCPKCRTPIKKCMRLMNHIKKTFTDIYIIKQKVFGDEKQLKNQQEQYLQTLETYMSQHQIILKEIPVLKTLLQNLRNQTVPINNQKKQVLCAQEINALGIILDLLKQMFNYLSLIKTYKSKSYELTKNQVIMLAQSFPTKCHISNQEINDINLELGRLKCMANLSQIDSKRINNGLVHEDQKEYDVIVAKLVDIKKFTSTIEKEVIKHMSIIGDFEKNLIAERRMIHKAMGFGTGHWFKCPNGHIYAIGDCGGAQQSSKCPECKAAIGGENYRISRGNTLASEMDGAARPAYPTTLHNYNYF